MSPERQSVRPDLNRRPPGTGPGALRSISSPSHRHVVVPPGIEPGSSGLQPDAWAMSAWAPGAHGMSQEFGRANSKGTGVHPFPWTWRDSNPHVPACKAGACPDSATGPGSACPQGSGGRIRTSNLLLNREMPVLLGYTGSCPDPRNRTSPALRRQGYSLADIPVSRSGWYSR